MNIVTTEDGYQFDLDSLPSSYVYSGGVLSYISITVPDGNSSEYRQTYTYSGGNISAISKWEKQ